MLMEIGGAATYTRRWSTKMKMEVELEQGGISRKGLEVRMFQKINEPAPNIIKMFFKHVTAVRC